MSEFTLPGAAKPTLSHGNTKQSIGNKYISREGVCQDGENSSRCFLDPETRNLLFIGVGTQIGIISGMLGSAVAHLRIQELIKEPPDVDPIVDLLIDAATGYLGKLASKAVKAVRSAKTQTIVEMAIAIDGDAVKEADEGVVGYAIKGGTSLAKKGATRAAKKDDKDAFEEEKEASMDFLSVIQNSLFAALRSAGNEGFSNLGDADRILLYKTLESVTPDGLEAALSAALKSYQSSPASKIGRTRAERHLEKPAKGSSLPDAMKHTQKEIADKKIDSVNDVRNLKLVQQEYDNGQPPKLFYYKRDFDGGMADAPGGDALMDTEREYPSFAAKDATYVVYKEVEPDFVEIAVANNVKHWGRKYDVEKVHVPDLAQQAANHQPEPEPEPYRPPIRPKYR